MSIKKLAWLLIATVFLVVFLYAAILLYLTWPISELSISRSGVFGDSFGPLTSLFTGLAFAGLIVTIVMQKDELALQRNELNLTRKEMRAQNKTLKIQRFENTFFKMLEFLDLSRSEITYTDLTENEEPFKGKSAISKIYSTFFNSHLHERVPTGIPQGLGPTTKTVFKKSCKTKEGITRELKELLTTKYGENLAQYFKTLYRILKFVDGADFIKNKHKHIYTSLVRAQLSRYEPSLLFYNCISDFGAEKMAPLVKKYRLLKHMDPHTIPVDIQEIWTEFNSWDTIESDEQTDRSTG